MLVASPLAPYPGSKAQPPHNIYRVYTVALNVGGGGDSW